MIKSQISTLLFRMITLFMGDGLGDFKIERDTHINTHITHLLCNKSPS